MDENATKAPPSAQQLAEAIVFAARNYTDKGLTLFELLCSYDYFDVNMEGTEEILSKVAKGGPLRHLRKFGDRLELVAVGHMALSLAGHSANLQGKGSFHITRIKGDQLNGGLFDIIPRRCVAPFWGYLVHKFTGLSFSGPLGPLVGSVFVFHRDGLVFAAARVAGIWLLPPDF